MSDEKPQKGFLCWVRSSSQFLFTPLNGAIATALIVVVLTPMGQTLVQVPILGVFFKSLCEAVNAPCAPPIYLVYDPTANLSPIEDLPEVQKQLEEQHRTYKRLLSANHHDPIAWTNFGETLRQLGFPRQAITAHKRALAIDKNLEPALLGLALAQAKLGNYDAANAAIDQTIQRNPKRALNYACKGEILALQPNKQGAKAALEEALKEAHRLDATIEPILNNLCGVLNW